MDENDTLGQPGTVTDSATSNVVDTRPARDALADILDDPETDTEEDVAHAEDEDDAGLEGSEEDTSEEDSGEQNPGEKPDGPSGDGRFVEHSARVKLPDGTTTTVQELTKGYLRQSDYTRKRQADAEDRKVFDSERERVGQTAQHLQTQLERMNAMLEQWKPQRPTTSPADDPVGWMTYQQQVEAWKDWEGRLDTEAQQFREKSTTEQQTAIRTRLEAENRALVEKFSAMSDPAKRTAFFNEAGSFMGKYGFRPEDVHGIGDHRLILIIRDLMRADRLAAKAPQVAAQVKDKPKMVRGGKRGSDPAAASRQARIERLRETGSRADARRALMDLDL